MNLPNKLTVLRILLVPLFVVLLLVSEIPYSTIIALGVFVIASITDFFDGRIARKRNQVTTLGKFLDPIADKILVLSAMICLIPLGLCNPAVVIIVIARELLVSSLRLVAALKSVVIAAGWSGKVKTASQMISLVAVLVMLSITQLFGTALPIVQVSNWLMWITASIAVFSGIEYLACNRALIKSEY